MVHNRSPRKCHLPAIQEAGLDTVLHGIILSLEMIKELAEVMKEFVWLVLTVSAVFVATYTASTYHAVGWYSDKNGHIHFMSRDGSTEYVVIPDEVREVKSDQGTN